MTGSFDPSVRPHCRCNPLLGDGVIVSPQSPLRSLSDLDAGEAVASGEVMSMMLRSIDRLEVM